MASACFSPPTVPPAPDGGSDAGPSPPSITDARVEDAAGRPWPAAAAPRRPVLVIDATDSLDGDPDPVMLLSGHGDDALRADLARAPLRASDLARLVPSRIERNAGRVTVTPGAPLEPGAAYTLVVGGWASDADAVTIDAPFMMDLTIASEASGARVVSTWPADGTAGVPPSLALAAVRFDDVVQGVTDGIWLEDSDGHPVEGRVASVPCVQVGWSDGSCAALEPSAPLDPDRLYRIEVGAGVRDRTGAGVGPFTATFHTGPDDGAPPAWIAAPCGVDEVPVLVGCQLADDGSITVAVHATGPLRLWLRTRAGSASAVAPRGDAVLRLEGLAPSTDLPATLSAIDLGGRERLVPLSLATTPPLPPIRITETLENPLGPEPRQEYVEVLNSGAMPIDLNGYSLADRADRAGDLVDSSCDRAAGGTRATGGGRLRSERTR